MCLLEVVQGSKTQYLFHPAPTKDALWYLFQKYIFWFCSKFDHKLLGTYKSLVQAVLSLAAGRTISCPRSLSLTLLKNFFQNVKLHLFRHRLMVRCEENMPTKKMYGHLFNLCSIITFIDYQVTNDLAPTYSTYVVLFITNMGGKCIMNLS